MPSVFVSPPDVDIKPPHAASMVQAMNNACALPSKGCEPVVEEVNIRQNAVAVMARTLGAWLVQDSPRGIKTSWRDQVKDRELAISMTSSLLTALRSGKPAFSKTKEPG
jgi:hypothetical protein